MSEQDFIAEQSSLTESLRRVMDRLSELDAQNTQETEHLYHSESYILLTQKMLSNRAVNYKQLIKEIDPRILKDFIQTVSTNFCIKNGRVMSITFKNGIKHEFIYADD